MAKLLLVLVGTDWSPDGDPLKNAHIEVEMEKPLKDYIDDIKKELSLESFDDMELCQGHGEVCVFKKKKKKKN